MATSIIAIIFILVYIYIYIYIYIFIFFTGRNQLVALRTKNKELVQALGNNNKYYTHAKYGPNIIKMVDSLSINKGQEKEQKKSVATNYPCSILKSLHHKDEKYRHDVSDWKHWVHFYATHFHV